MKRWVASACLILLLAGCASLPEGPGCVRIGPAGAACLLAPAALPKVSARHLVSVTHDGRTDTFLGRLQIDATALRLVGSSLFGTPLFTLAWDGHAISMEPHNEQMPPGLMLAMLEAAIVPPERLRPHLYGIDLTVTTAADGGQVRELHEKGRLVARIHVPAGPLASATLEIEVPPAHLRLRLQPLPTGQGE